MCPDLHENGLRRRRFLSVAVAGTAAVAGCLSGGNDPVASVEESVTIDERDWASFEFTLGNHGRIEFEGTVVDGPAVDFLLMHDAEFENYADDDRFDFVQSASVLDVFEATVDEQVPPGEYAFVVDNTNRVGGLLPNDGSKRVPTVEVTLTAYTS